MENFWKGRHIVAYIALKHHSRFIVPILKHLADQGAHISYLVAQAERSQEITAIETGLDYHHVFDFLSPQDRTAIQKIYISMRDAFAKTLTRDIAFSLQVQTVLDKTLYATAQEYVAFKNFFKIQQPDLCIALHEVNRWGKMFAFHSKLAGIPFVTLQEGLLTAASANLSFQMTGHVQYSTLSLVWGEKSREKLANFEAPKNRILPIGNTHLSNEIKMLKKNNVRGRKRKAYKIQNRFGILLLFSSDLPDWKEISPIYEAATRNPRLKIFTKFHPATTRLMIDQWLGQFSSTTKSNINPIHGEESTYDLIAMSDLCVLSEGSTTGLEALAIGRPLVLLSLIKPVVYESNLVEQKAAVDLTPRALADILIQDETRISAMMNPEGVAEYIKNELYKPDGSIEYGVDLRERLITNNQTNAPRPLSAEKPATTDWSIVLPVSDAPDTFLDILENIAAFSEPEKFEVILLKDHQTHKEVQTILDSLEGDVKILEPEHHMTAADIHNRAAGTAGGQTLVFLEKNITPAGNWLQNIKEGIKTYGTDKIYGARIMNRFNNVVHAGMVMNSNNQAVSAYAHIDENFPHVCKTRSFQMVDQFMVTDRDFFLRMGGFHPEAGSYRIMDFCLNAQEKMQSHDGVIYLHSVLLTQMLPSVVEDPMGSLFFHARWHGKLWDSEDTLYEKDGVSKIQLEAARFTRAMKTLG